MNQNALCQLKPPQTKLLKPEPLASKMADEKWDEKMAKLDFW